MARRLIPALTAMTAALVAASLAWAQDKGTLDPKPLPPLANPSDPATPAKELFGRAREAAPQAQSRRSRESKHRRIIEEDFSLLVR